MAKGPAVVSAKRPAWRPTAAATTDRARTASRVAVRRVDQRGRFPDDGQADGDALAQELGAVVEQAEIRDPRQVDEPGPTEEVAEKIGVQPHLVIVVRVGVSTEEHAHDVEPL